ncbi:MAG: JAB domain-containing protein [Lactobacillaceae bacterium]|jgi:DNA repair protein RadC|nr:JAB domain-containing protein [Lactobacillaceae bacterium]
MVESTEQIARLLEEKIGDLPQEECWVLYFDTQLRILDIACIAKGTLDKVMIHPRDVFRRGVALNAYGIVVAHNHPSGKVSLSNGDVQVARQLVLCGSLLQIHVLDFLVVTRTDYLSYFELEKLPQIRLETLLELWTTHANMC